ncbi:MAG: hypothetical protein IJZ85_04580 [Lachnospiraceae bacterium]|nr:hypothetical protein [Lachnospiraceae bacterium]
MAKIDPDLYSDSGHDKIYLIYLYRTVGGRIWQTPGMEPLFSAFAVPGLCSSAYAATIKGKRKA